jgi:regulator of sigma E protease
MNVLLNIVLIFITILFFLCVILVHELGHFLTAKMTGVRANEFAIGMGPKVFSKKGKETLYSLRLLPVGGFCTIEGEEKESNDPSSFNKKPIWVRMLIIFAGAGCNILLGFVLSMILLIQQPYFISTKISSFKDGAISSSSGLQKGDKILSVNGYSIQNSRDLLFAFSLLESKTAEVKILRDEKKILQKNVKFPVETTDKNKEILGIDFFLEKKDKNLVTVFEESASYTISNVKIVWTSLVKIFTMKFSFKEISGPIGIVTAVSKSASEGLQTSVLEAANNIINIMNLITVNLGIFNLLPFPSLDGGRLVFLIFEAITRKRIPEKYEVWINMFGFVTLLLLMLLFSFGDIVKLFSGGNT